MGTNIGTGNTGQKPKASQGIVFNAINLMKIYV